MSFVNLPQRLKSLWKKILNLPETCRVAYIQKTIPTLIGYANSLDFLQEKDLVTFPFKLPGNCFLGGILTHVSPKPNVPPKKVYLFQHDEFIRRATPDVNCKCTPMAIAYASADKNFIIANDILITLGTIKTPGAQMLVKAIFAHELGHIEDPATIVLDNSHYDAVLEGELRADTTLYFSDKDPGDLYYNVMILGLYSLNATMTPRTSKCALDRLYNLASWIYIANLPLGTNPTHKEGSETQIGKKIYNMLLETATDECFYPIKKSFTQAEALKWHMDTMYIMQRHLCPDDLRIVEA